MERTIKHALSTRTCPRSALTLAAAWTRATDAETAITEGQTNQAIGAALGIETMLEEARALFGAALALHRGGRP